MRSVVYIIVILSVLSTYPPADAAPKRKRAAKGCVRDGSFFPVGHIVKPKPCKTCTCDPKGKFTCVTKQCPRPRCVDPDESTCCPTCPNGHNCLRPDGLIVSVSSYTHSEAGFCRCTEEEAGMAAACWCAGWPADIGFNC